MATIAYHFHRTHPGDVRQRDVGELVRVPAEQVCHVFHPIAEGQIRGVPWVAPAMVRLWLLDQYDDAATFAAFGIAGGESASVRVIARRPDAIVGFGETRIHAETATFELRASEVASPRPDDQLTLGGETFVVQGEPERRDPDRLVWSLDTRLA
jgi:hypothetical protein